MKQAQKPMIETLINTTALSCTSMGMIKINSGDWSGYVLISFGMVLEFMKYYARKIKLWK